MEIVINLNYCTDGYQMMASRVHESRRVRCNSEMGKDRLEGLQPVCEDWLAKASLLEV